jgi:peptidoglycan/LPS O-acetylase OafA/YrhL
MPRAANLAWKEALPALNSVLVLRRVPQLDLLRGFAVLAVIANHSRADAPVFRAGWAGVDLFFVLSGFLISGLLFDEIAATGTTRPGRFLLRRGMKIYPSFFFMLLMCALLDPRRGYRHYWSEVFFVQNYIPGVWIHTWSLAVEEHFYLVLPFVILLLHHRKKLHWIPVISLVLLACCLGLRAAMLVKESNPDLIASATHTRADALFAGVALSYLMRFRPEKLAFLRHWAFPVLSIILLIPCFTVPRDSRFMLSVGLLANTIAFTFILGWIIQHEEIRVRAIERIGIYSYSIYLWHVICVYFCRVEFGPAMSLAVCFPLAIMIGITMASIVEFPVLALRDRFIPAIEAYRKGYGFDGPERPFPSRNHEKAHWKEFGSVGNRSRLS